MSHDKNSLLYFSTNRTLSTYDIAAKKWQLGTPLGNGLMYTVYSSQVATDPSTGIVYIPSKEDSSVVERRRFMMNSYNTLQANNANITMTYFPQVTRPYESYGAVWSTVRKSVLIYGGVWGNPETVALDLMEYQPSNNQWTAVKTQGTTIPGAFRQPCMASAYGGMKIIMFGNTASPFSVFILDVKTLVWTKGADPKPGLERNAPSCTVVGDYFIAFGGASAGTIVEQAVIVYNIKLNQWTDSYEAPNTPSASVGAKNSSTTETASSDQQQSSGEGMPLGAKIGIIAGGSSSLVLLLTCGAFIIRRRKMRKFSQTHASDKELPKPNLESAEEDKTKYNTDGNDSNDSNNNNESNENNGINDNNANSDGNDINDYTDAADKTGDNIQLRDILASLDYLTNRFDQQHGNPHEEAIFDGDEGEEFYEDDLNYLPYPGEGIDPYSSSVLDLEYEGGDYDPYEYAYHPPPPIGNNTFPTDAYIPPPFPDTTEQQLEHDNNPYFNKSTLEPSESRQQQPVVQNKAMHETPSHSPNSQLRSRGARNPQNLSAIASSSSLDGLLKPRAPRHPQHHSSSIPTVAVQQWQCAQQGQDPQYIPPPPSVPAKPAFAHHPRQDPQENDGGYHDRLDHRTYYHDQRRNEPQGAHDHHRTVGNNNNTKYHDRPSNGPQEGSGTPNDDEDYLAMYQDPRMNAPQEHSRASTDKNASFPNTPHRLNPQDHHRQSTASHLEFYQDRSFNNPQEHGPPQADQDDGTLYLEIQRIRAQQEEYMLQRQKLERIRLENEAKLRTLSDRAKYAQPRGGY
ncbi:unnamed protein product [Mortierella alpina]